MNIEELFIKYATEGWSGDAACLGLDQFNQALTEYRQGQWISVEERLPEKMQDILFTVVGVKNMKNEFIPPSVHYGWMDLASRFRSYIDPRDGWLATHWMALPLPPSPNKEA